VETFDASKLTRRRDPALASLYEQLLAARRDLPTGNASEISYDEAARWLQVRRGTSTIVCNFAAAAQEFDVEAMELVLATDPAATLSETTLTLPPLAGALLRAAAL
jgi:hypothetical protein